MLFRSFARTVGVLCLATIACSGLAHAAPVAAPQNSNIFEALADRGVRTSLQAKDLTPAWRVVRLEVNGLANVLRRANGNNSLPWADLYYTRGDITTVGGQTFLVAYRVVPPVDPEELRQMRRFWMAWQNTEEAEFNHDLPQLEENASLSLSLLQIDQGMSLHDIRAFDPHRDILTEEGKAKRRVQYDRAMSQSNLKQIALGLKQYLQDYDEKLPPMRAARSARDFQSIRTNQVTPTTPVQVMLQPYLRATDIFVHPTTKRPYLPNYRISRRFEYEFNSSTTITFFEDAPDAEGKRNVAFLDGRVEALDEEEWQKLRKEQGISDSGLPSALPTAGRRSDRPLSRRPSAHAPPGQDAAPIP